MTREQLTDEVVKLGAGVRAHRDATLNELCWHHPGLWGLLPERTDPLPPVPERKISCVTASPIANPSTHSSLMRPESMRRTKVLRLSRVLKTPPVNGRAYSAEYKYVPPSHARTSAPAAFNTTKPYIAASAIF